MSRDAASSDAVAPAVVEKLRYSVDALDEWVAARAPAEAGEAGAVAADVLAEYPSVYVVKMPDGPKGKPKYEVYVGESNSIEQRTRQHLIGDTRTRDTWRRFAESAHSEMFVIGHEKFNKSLTLDIENQIVHWLTSSQSISKLHNRRANPQGKYYTKAEFEAIFDDIWAQLRKQAGDIFPSRQQVRESALFKASPFHELTPDQERAKAAIVEAVSSNRETTGAADLILVEGAAGTGKTVLLSSVFRDLCDMAITGTFSAPMQAHADGHAAQPPAAQTSPSVYMLVNHDQQLTVYKEVASKLGLTDGGMAEVDKPTRFITRRDPNHKADVVLIDEAHLLWTQGKQSYRGQNMLDDILERAKLVVAIYDPKQVLNTNQYVSPENYERMVARAGGSPLQLGQQMRIQSSKETWEWLRAFIDEGVLAPVPADESYDLQIMDSAADLAMAVRTQAEIEGRGNSRILATVDWEYSSGSKPPNGEHWMVTVDDFSAAWNLQLPRERSVDRNLAWAEQPQTIDEVGSMWTIQGFDLEYAGVILGPSVQYRNGKVVIDPELAANKHATQRRTMADGSKESVAELLLRNQLNVLLTRGVKGLFLYACDQELQKALQDAHAAGARA